MKIRDTADNIDPIFIEKHIIHTINSMTTATKSIRIVSAICFVIGVIQFALSMKMFASFDAGTNFGAW